MEQQFNNSIAVPTFNLNRVYDDIFIGLMCQTEEINTQKENLETLLGTTNSKKAIKHLLRFSFFIEPVKKPKIDSTKYNVRWSDELTDDPRYSTYDNCYLIFESLLTQLIVDLQQPENKTVLNGIIRNSKVSCEIPVDYNERASNPIHEIENINWIWGDLPSEVVKLRSFLTDATKHEYSEFFKGVYKKIKVKTYLTDRVLTGDYKTNREKRWECHPSSVHFALRRIAWEIEIRLVNQVCNFHGFPEDLKAIMVEAEIMEFDDSAMKCPITFEPMSFESFKAEIENTTHGKSDFQVGHMNPLKAELEGETGHSANNISWISEQGNRIQGSNSVTETRRLLLKIHANYIESGIDEIAD